MSLAEAPFGRVGDDNGPGSEPPPRIRIGIVTAFVPSRLRSPAAYIGNVFCRHVVWTPQTTCQMTCREDLKTCREDIDEYVVQKSEDMSSLDDMSRHVGDMSSGLGHINLLPRRLGLAVTIITMINSPVAGILSTLPSPDSSSIHYTLGAECFCRCQSLLSVVRAV